MPASSSLHSFTAKKLGNIPLWRGASKQALELVDNREISLYELCERFPPEIMKPLAEKLGIKEMTMQDNVILFRNVSEHWDDPQFLPEGQVGGFLHVVLAGSFMLHVGLEQLQCQRGDVVLMNPQHKHKVTTKSKLCATAAFTVPLELWYDKTFA